VKSLFIGWQKGWSLKKLHPFLLLGGHPFIHLHQKP
jgi:hypothetical protein